MRLVCIALFSAIVVVGSIAVNAQVDDICTAAGNAPSLDSPFSHVPYVLGRVELKGIDPASKQPKVVVILADTGQPSVRWNLDRSGKYCFRRNGAGGTIIVEVDGSEVARRSLPSFGSAQQREDFDIVLNDRNKRTNPGAVSAKFFHEPNPRTLDQYRKAAEAEKSKDTSGLIKALKEIVAIDPEDFIAWAKLGMVYFRENSYPEADGAYRKSLEVRVDYTPAWLGAGHLRMAEKRFETAIEILKHVLELEPELATAYRSLGEAYLQVKKGTLGAEALNKAISLDPAGMAECHLLLARLYDLAGAKHLAASEYKIFLTKVSNHPDRKKFEKYIKDNSEK